MLVISCFLIPSNSSIQQMPPSASTNAPASNDQLPSSLTAVAVSPAVEVALPLVTTDRGLKRAAYFKNWDLPNLATKDYQLIGRHSAVLCSFLIL